MGKCKLRKCSICQKRPRYKHKKKGFLHCCKKCYHAHVWENRPSLRKEKKKAQELAESVGFDDPDLGEFDWL